MALLAGGVAFVTLTRATATKPAGVEVSQNRSQVVVAVHRIALRRVIQKEDVELKEMPADLVPEGAVRQVEEAVGKIATAELFPQEIVISSRLADPTVQGKAGQIAFTMEEDKVTIAIPPLDLMSDIELLKPGDRVDILVSLDKEGRLITVQTLQNLEIAAIVTPGSKAQEKATGETEAGKPSALLFALDPQDALILKHLIDSGSIVDVALRAPTNERLFETQPVDMDYLSDRYRLRR